MVLIASIVLVLVSVSVSDVYSLSRFFIVVTALLLTLLNWYIKKIVISFIGLIVGSSVWKTAQPVKK